MNPSLEALRECEAELRDLDSMQHSDGLIVPHSECRRCRIASRIKAAREALEAEMARLAQLVMENTEP